MSPHIAHLIAQAEQWRSEHIRAGHLMDAAACTIRIQALYDAAGVRRPKSSGRGPAA